MRDKYVLSGARLATMEPGAPYGMIEAGAVAIDHADMRGAAGRRRLVANLIAEAPQ